MGGWLRVWWNTVTEKIQANRCLGTAALTHQTLSLIKPKALEPRVMESFKGPVQNRLEQLRPYMQIRFGL